MKRRINPQSAIREQQPSQWSILRWTARNSFFVTAAPAGRATCILRVRVIARRGNTLKAKKASRVISSWNSARSRMLHWLVIQTQANRHCSEKFRRRVRRWQRIRLPRCIRLSAWLSSGLIEGAHRGLGLGHEFLRHITRCRILLFVVDVAGSESRNPTEDLLNLRREIDLYDPILSKRPWCIIANKMDLPGARENLEALKNRFSTVEIAALSAQTGEGLEDLRVKLEKWLVNASERQPIDRAQTDRASSGN
jgi:hypothetical protein